MRGSPLLRALLTLLVLSLSAWPVWRVTHAVAPAAPAPAAHSPESGTARLEVAFLPVPPVEFEVKYLGNTVWRSGGKLAEASPSIAMQIPAEGIDLQVTARWPDDVRSAAARIQVVTPDGATLERLAWTHNSPALDEVLTFQSR